MDGDLTDGVTIYFKGNIKDPEFEKNVANFIQNVDEVWGDQLGQDLSNVTFAVVGENFSTDDLESGENLVTFGTNGTSNVSGKKNNNVYINTTGGGNTASHEFGHVLGLADRYEDNYTFNQTKNSNSKRLNTIPHSQDVYNEPDYNPTNNLMANGGTALSAKQLKIANSKRTERNRSFIYVHPDNKQDYCGNKDFGFQRKGNGFKNIGKYAAKYLNSQGFIDVLNESGRK